MGSAPAGTFFEHLDALGAPPGAARRVARVIATTFLLILTLALLLGASAFAFGPSRILFDRSFLPQVLGALLVLCVLQRLAGPGATRWSAPARSALSLVFLLGAFCFLNEAWSFLRRAL
jgi:hypothetical protein